MRSALEISDSSLLISEPGDIVMNSRSQILCKLANEVCLKSNILP